MGGENIFVYFLEFCGCVEKCLWSVWFNEKMGDFIYLMRNKEEMFLMLLLEVEDLDDVIIDDSDEF